MSQGRVNVSTISSPPLLWAAEGFKPVRTRAQLFAKLPFLGLNRAAQGPLFHDVCETCASINFDDLPRAIEGAVPHHLYADLIESTSTCQLCRVIVYAIGCRRDEIVRNIRDGAQPYLWSSRYITGPMPEIEAATRVWLFGAWQFLESAMPPHYLMGLGTMLAKESSSERLAPKEADGNTKGTTFMPGASVRICTEAGDPMSRVVPGRVPFTGAGDRLCFNIARNWMGSCQRSHDCEPKDVSLPSRVLSITKPADGLLLRLIETGGRKGKYIALSHCWGHGQHTTMTSRNIERFRQDVPIDELPKTFQDAVQAAIEFGIDYVWIDSLCIMQDSPDDWASESMMMADIYANATVTICAAASSSDEEGVFVTRPAFYNPPGHHYGLRDTRPSAIATAVVNVSSGQKSSLSFFPQPINDGKAVQLGSPLDPIRFDPLCSRAWAFQERILSPRKLLYGVDQLYWECNHFLLSEDGTRGTPGIPLLSQVQESEKSGVNRRKKGWPMLVEAYSKGKLSYATDKLPALAGLAAKIASTTNDKYYAGVWGRYLWRDLMWRVTFAVEAVPFGYEFVEDFEAHRAEQVQVKTKDENHTEHPWLSALAKWRNIVTPECSPPPPFTRIKNLGWDGEDVPSDTKGRRHPKFVAPTWSFASIEAQVSHTYKEMKDIVAKCISISTKLDGPDRYGRVSTGSLTIKAPLIPLKEAPKNSKTFFHGSKATIDIPFFAEMTGRQIENVFWDTEPVLPCWALFINPVCALLVVPRRTTDESNETWERAGSSDAIYGFKTFWEMTNQAEKERWIKTITIV